MKQNILTQLLAFQRPIGFLLLLLPTAALLWSYRVAESITQTAIGGRAGPADVAMILGELHGLFREYVIPILIAAVVLAFLNLCYCCFAGRSTRASAS